ncbi:MAG: hypothetical protein K0R00_164 [Herbinix sp.]|nr:hypothetical protein [Herbinix sp.]
MSYTDIERDLEARYVKGLKRIFEFDNEFMYNNSDSQTKLVVTTEFPSEEQPFRTPHIVVSGIGFQNDTGFGFNNNFYRDVAMNGIQNYSSLYMSQVPYSISLICLGRDDISRNLANRVFYYLNYRAFKYMSDSLMLNIRGVAKNPSSPKEQYPEKIFQTPILVQGSLTLQVEETPFDYLEGNVSKPINKLGKAFTSIRVSVDNK